MEGCGLSPLLLKALGGDSGGDSFTTWWCPSSPLDSCLVAGPRVLAALPWGRRSPAAPQAASPSGFLAGRVKLGRQTELFAYQEEGLAS